jgi:site-specific DNA-methyltransferase (adenine-specific)
MTTERDQFAHPRGNAPTLMLGDCLTRMREIPSDTVDLILADLPYGVTRCAWDSVIPLPSLWEQYCRVLRPRGAVVLTAMQPFASALVMSKPDWFLYDWVWEKGNATGFLNAKRAPLRAHESVLVFAPRQPTYNPQFTHGHARKTAKRKTVNSECYGKALKLVDYDSTSRYPRSVQFFSSDKQRGNFHPTQKPMRLMEYLIRTYSNPGDLVLDNAMGSGTTGVACRNTGRVFIGIESDAAYFAIAQRRIFLPLELAVEAA